MEELVGLVVPIGLSKQLHHHLRARNYHDDAASGRLSWLLEGEESMLLPLRPTRS